MGGGLVSIRDHGDFLLVSTLQTETPNTVYNPINKKLQGLNRNKMKEQIFIQYNAALEA